MKSTKLFPVVRHLESVSMTSDVADSLSRILRAGDLLLFTGTIGAGKTTFIQFLAKSLGVKETVTSPTFVLHAIYESGIIPLSHVDLYRLNTDAEVESFGFEDYYDISVTAVEWADRYSNFQPPYLLFDFAYGTSKNERVLTITPNGGDWATRLESI